MLSTSRQEMEANIPVFHFFISKKTSQKLNIYHKVRLCGFRAENASFFMSAEVTICKVVKKGGKWR